MNIRITFRHMEHSAAIESHVRKELEKITKFLQREDDSTVHLDCVLEAAKIHAHHRVELRLNSQHYHLIASHEGADLYQEIDRVVKTMVHEIKKHKEKSLDKRNHPQTRKEDFLETAAREEEEEDDIII